METIHFVKWTVFLLFMRTFLYSMLIPIYNYYVNLYCCNILMDFIRKIVMKTRKWHFMFFFIIVIFTGFLCFFQDLTQASSFSGFSSLATLLIRHVMEDPVTLRQTMEKVIRSSTVNSSSSNTKELHYLLACLAPAACRSPQLFAEVNFPPLF